MATFRKRQLKSGVVYDIQVKFKEPNTNQTIVKTTVWHPEYKMTDKQAERECALIAQKFENDVKQLYTGSVADVPDYNITVGQMADKWLERVHKDFSIAYYERGIKTIEWIKRYIGGYKIREVTPYVIQNFYDKLDREQRVIYTVTAKPALREAIDNFGHTRRELSMDYGVNVASLVIALQGKQIGMEFARSISSALGTKPEKLFYIQKAEQPYAAETIAKVKRATRCIFAMAKRQRLVDDNYASADFVSYGKKPKRDIKYLDDEQAKELFRVLMDYDDIRAKTAVLVALMTGLRRGEIAGLEWKDINFERHILTVNRTGCYSKIAGGIFTKEPKTEGSVRRITISEVLVEMLKEYKVWYDEQRANWGDRWVDSDRLFVQEYGKPINPSTIHFWLKKMLKESNLPDVTLHSLRHTNITLQIAAGVPLTTVAGRAGHSRVSTTSDIYSHFIKTSDEAAAEALEDIFLPRAAKG